MLRQAFLACVSAAALAFSPLAAAQDFPQRQISIVFPGVAGGEPDGIARLIADQLHDRWGQPVVVENRPGAGGNIGAEYVARAAPDGLTLLFTGVGALAIGKAVYSKLGYDPDKLVPVSVVVSTPLVVVANNDVPVRSLPDLLAYAKANPGKLNYGSAGNGTTTHLTGELLKSMGKLDIVHVAYKGLAPALTDLVGKQVDLVVMDIGTALPYIRAGKIRALAVTTRQRSPLLPEVPAVAEALPGFESTFSFVVVAPAGTPAPVVSKLASAISEGMRKPQVARSLLDKGTLVVAGSAQDAAAQMEQERERWGALVRSLGIKLD